jgi:arylsulfatase A-like enzyme
VRAKVEIQTDQMLRFLVTGGGKPETSIIAPSSLSLAETKRTCCMILLPTARLLLSAILLLGVTFFASAANVSKPNIIFILIDNLGQEWFDCYGSEEHCTPQIDRLAATGVRFANCYTSTVCGPSRVELLTGRYPFRTGWYLHHDAALYSGGGFDPQREITIARALRDAGYATGLAGKWQINNLYDEPDALRQHGFQESLVTPMSIDRDKVDDAFWQRFRQAIRNNDADFLQESTRKQESRYWDPVMIRNGKREVLKGRFGPDVFQEFAIDFVRRHREGPFFLYYPMVLTHGSSAAHAVTATPANRGHPPKDDHAAFADMVRYTDSLVGDFVAALDNLGVRDNTILIVASDNGTDESFVGRRNGRRVKGGLYKITENGGNVGFLVNSPKLVPGGRVGSLTDFTDVFPTLCDFAGAPLPRGVALDGRSYKNYLQGKGQVPRQWIFNEYRPDRVVRDERYKLWGNGNFYDLEEDPGETRPLPAGPNPAAERAREKLQAVLSGMPADTPLPFMHLSLSAFRQRAAAARK